MDKELIAIITKDGFELDWQETKEKLDPDQIEMQKSFYEGSHEEPYRELYLLGYKNRAPGLSGSVYFLYKIANKFALSLSKIPEIEFLRENTDIEIETGFADQILNDAPFMNGMEFLNIEWFEMIWKSLKGIFASDIKEYPGSVADYFTALSPLIHLPGRVYFHLVESKKEDYPFAFLATYSISDTGSGKVKHLPLKNALVEYKGNNKKLLELLSTVNKASQNSKFILGLLDSGEIFHPIGLSANEAYAFLKDITIFQEAGILCRIPNWWKNRSNSPRVSVSIGDKAPSHLGFDSLVKFDVKIAIGDEELSVEEIKKLLSETEGLAFIKGKWIELDHAKLEEMLTAFENANMVSGEKELSILEAMRFQLNASKALGINDEDTDIEITNGEWLENILSQLTHTEKIDEVSCGEDFLADLRPYQKKGLSWLNLMKVLGLGACLADDMGLGKTVQVIALLNHVKDKRKEKTLLVIPASLIGNWINEITRFAPLLKYKILHPSEINRTDDITKEIEGDEDIYITTYSMVKRYKELVDIQWDNLILDEAQAIKNPKTKQTRAVKQLNAKYRLAMTGTPIENRLLDLWSLFDFINKGLLGTTKEFSAFTNKLKEHYQGYSRLKKTVGPFILRRLKTDKKVIEDLPEKIEMKTYSALSKKQAALYSSLVDEIKKKLENTEEGIQRKGLILSSIMKFKQICNHPDQYLGQELYSEKDSGKFDRLREICQTIYDKRERVLVFTQFREMTDPLKRFLEAIFQHEGLVLHGGTPVAKRRKIVDRFQGHEYIPFLVLSIKAGGVGLNLTSANHVIHFDRWWNPAVEDQATDRAFRIGQKKNVLVHKFITKGTIEEKIDIMIEDKIKLTKDIIPSKQEKWITEMDNRQLMDMMRLTIN